MKRWMILRILGVLLTLGLATPQALAATAEERLAQDYLEAVARGDAGRLLDFYHPDEITALRARVVKALEAEAAAGGDSIRTRAFGIATPMEVVRRATPANLFVQLSARLNPPADRIGKAVALGTVTENQQTVHVLARLTPPPGVQARPPVVVVTLLRYGKDWRVALPVSFQAEVDKLLQTSASAPAADPAKQSAPNSDDINALLERGVELMTNGKCASYFNELMSPTFRASTSAQALQRLIAQCERSVDTRETYIAALQVARKATPRYEDSGTRAVYDMAGKGLPFQRFVLERVDRRWYIAE